MISDRFSAANLRRGYRQAWWGQTLRGLGLLILAIAALAYTQWPVDMAALMGSPWLDGHNATFFRAAIVALAVVITLSARNHPWYHTVVAALLAVGHGGQVLRAVFSPDATPMPLSLVFLNAAIITYLIVLGVRPTVHELLAEERALRADLEEENERVTAERDALKVQVEDLQMFLRLPEPQPVLWRKE